VEFHVDDLSVFLTLTRLKALQYRRTGARDLFADPWTLDVLHAVFRTQEPQFSGVLSALFIGDDVAAALFGMRSHSTLHCWFSAYDPRFARHSPGMLLLVELAHRGPGHGIEVIDLGTGPQAYKSRLATGAVNVLRGRIERPSLAFVWRAARRSARRLAGCLRS
jgi:CelD/BcsL family acetyltransferase involved in cellulose biosynthesis